MLKINFKLGKAIKTLVIWDELEIEGFLADSNGIHFHHRPSPQRCFSAIKLLIKSVLSGNYDDMMVHYRELLTYIKSAVTRNHSEKSINSILDYVSVSKNVSFCVHFG